MQILFYILTIIYYYQAFFLGAGAGGLNLVALGGIVAISGWYLFNIIRSNILCRQPLFKIITLILSMFLLYFIFSEKEIDGIQTFSILKNIILFVAPFFPFYYWNSTGKLSIPLLKKFLLLIFALTAIQFVANNNSIEVERETENVVNNVGYSFLVLIPIIVLLYWDAKKMFVLLLSIVVLFVLMSIKRGAILCLILSLVVIGYYYLKVESKRHMVRNISVLIIFGIGLSYFISYLLDNSAFLQSRLEETMDGNSSGRDIIYLKSLNYWVDSSFFNKLFGSGLNTSIKISGKYAHSDWLEILTSLGLFGVMLYGILFFQINKLKCQCHLTRDKMVVGVLLCLWGAMSIFSMAMYSPVNYFFVIVLAIVFSNNVKFNAFKKHNRLKNMIE